MKSKAKISPAAEPMDPARRQAGRALAAIIEARFYQLFGRIFQRGDYLCSLEPDRLYERKKLFSKISGRRPRIGREVIALAIDPGTKNTGLAYIYRYKYGDGKYTYYIDILPCVQSHDMPKIMKILRDRILSKPDFQIIIGQGQYKQITAVFSRILENVEKDLRLLEYISGSNLRQLNIVQIDEAGSSQIAGSILNIISQKHGHIYTNIKSHAYQAGVDDSLAAGIIAGRWLTQISRRRHFPVYFDIKANRFCCNLTQGSFFSSKNHSKILTDRLESEEEKRALLAEWNSLQYPEF